MSPTVSLIICTHSPRPDYLARTLAALEKQTLPINTWELVVIDNASQPALTASLVAWHPRGRIVVEEKLGLTHARQRGISEVTGDIVVFADDDNLLSPDYLEQAIRIAKEHPSLGLWGCGHFTPEWEESPRSEFKPYLAYLAVGRHERDTWSMKPFDYAAMPAGAGLCVRASVARRYGELVASDPRRQRLGRRGGGLGGCEDFDLGLTSIALGFGTGIFTSLRLTHLMPAGRVREDYLLRLVEGHAHSTVLLHHLHDRPIQRASGPFAALRRWRYLRSLNPIDRRLAKARSRGEDRAFAELAQNR